MIIIGILIIHDKNNNFNRIAQIIEIQCTLANAKSLEDMPYDTVLKQAAHKKE